MSNQQTNLQSTMDEGKRLWDLVQQYAKLELVDKLTFILTILIVGGIVLALGAIAIYCFSMFVVTQLAESTGNLALSYSIVGLALLVIAFIVIQLRATLVTKPVIKSLLKEFFHELKEENK